MAGRGRSRAQARLATSLGFTAILVLGLLFALGLGGDADRATIAGSGGGSAVGLEAASELGENEGLEGDARLRTVDDQSQAVEISHQETAPVLEAGGGEEGRTQATPAPAAPALEVTQAPLERSPASPLADFSLSPAQGQSPLQVFLDASSSYDPDGSIVSYSWSFGGRGPALFHVFESNIIPANIAVTLTVTDDGGHSSTTTRHVTLY